VEALPWEAVTVTTLASNASLPLFSLETGGVSLYDFQFPASGILVAGSEELGVSPAALDLCRASAGIVSIPGYGLKGSLNVGVALGIALAEWARQLA
jgi:TrmH family RNA methyltransferase